MVVGLLSFCLNGICEKPEHPSASSSLTLLQEIVVEVARDVTGCLLHLHTCGIVAGDLSPVTIGLQRESAALSSFMPKITSFGQQVRAGASGCWVEASWLVEFTKGCGWVQSPG